MKRAVSVLKREPIRALYLYHNKPLRVMPQLPKPTWIYPQPLLQRCGWICTCLLLLGLLWGTAGAQQNLPSMGEPADSALSPSEERELGAQFMRQIRASIPLVRDVQSQEYIHSLGTRLAQASGKPDGTDFTFFIVRDAQINAFAIPGGYVGINLGLISAMSTEEQLAGVIAHEVAHVTQRHHARAFAIGSRNSLSAAAAILAAILIGQASPEAGQAALAAGLAATQQSSINFTRSNEIEADRIGIEILANAQYNPAAMAESFSILRRRNSLNTSAGQLQYLRTHPLDNNRIAEAKDRANNQQHLPPAPQIDFQLFKARLEVLSTEDAGQLLRAFQARFDQKPDAGNAYGLALLHARANRFSSATKYLNELNRIAPAHPMGTLVKANVMENQGDKSGSRELLQSLLSLYPNYYSIVDKLLDQLIRERKLGDAMTVVNRYLRHSDSPDPLAWRRLASIQQHLGDQAASHESLSRYFSGLNELERAASQLKLALQRVPTASQDEQRLQASLKALRNQLPRR